VNCAEQNLCFRIYNWKIAKEIYSLHLLKLGVSELGLVEILLPMLKLVASQWTSQLLAKAKGVHKNTRIYLFRPGNCKNISHATQKQHRAARLTIILQIILKLPRYSKHKQKHGHTKTSKGAKNDMLRIKTGGYVLHHMPYNG
jgi:hypothetical protein